MDKFSIVKGGDIIFRLVSEWDDQYIYSLRCHPELSKYLSRVTGTAEDQRSWIKDYKERENQGTEFYFIICLSNLTPVGTVRIYDYQKDSFSWGSWIVSPGAPLHVAITSTFIIYDIGFSRLGFSKSHFTVIKENKPVWSFHERFGAQRIDEDSQQYHYIFHSEYLKIAQQKYKKYLVNALYL